MTITPLTRRDLFIAAAWARGYTDYEDAITQGEELEREALRRERAPFEVAAMDDTAQSCNEAAIRADERERIAKALDAKASGLPPIFRAADVPEYVRSLARLLRDGPL